MTNKTKITKHKCIKPNQKCNNHSLLITNYRSLSFSLLFTDFIFQFVLELQIHSCFTNVIRNNSTNKFFVDCHCMVFCFVFVFAYTSGLGFEFSFCFLFVIVISFLVCICECYFISGLYL